jgi:hypothetical protein
VPKKEAAWLFKVDLTAVRGRCTRQFVQIVKKSVTFLSSPEETARFTAKNATQSAKIAAVKQENNQRRE